MDELAFSTSMRLKPYLLPELRMFFLLEKHYGIKVEDTRAASHEFTIWQCARYIIDTCQVQVR